MEKIIAHFGVETEESLFSLSIFCAADGSGYVAEYFGVTPKFPPGGMSERGCGRIVHHDASWLIASCLNDIVRIDGPIHRVVHHAFDASAEVSFADGLRRSRG
jgi:hypothetical protein